MSPTFYTFWAFATFLVLVATVTAAATSGRCIHASSPSLGAIFTGSATASLRVTTIFGRFVVRSSATSASTGRSFPSLPINFFFRFGSDIFFLLGLETDWLSAAGRCDTCVALAFEVLGRAGFLGLWGLVAYLLLIFWCFFAQFAIKGSDKACLEDRFHSFVLWAILVRFVLRVDLVHLVQVTNASLDKLNEDERLDNSITHSPNRQTSALLLI